MDPAPPDIGAQLERRRTAVANAWDLRDEIVLIGAGHPVPVPGRGDIAYPFRAHSEYFYLTDRERPGGVLAFDPADGWHDFVRPVSAAEILWEGASPGDLGGRPIAELDDWLATGPGRPTAWLGSPPVGASANPELEARLRLALNGVRRVKDGVELERMRRAVRAARAGFAAARAHISAGRTEREVQIELEAEFQRRGADAPGYSTIVGGGPHSAILHVAPSVRPMSDGELVLIDAGAEYRGYVSDVTRTYPVSGTFTEAQSELHALVEAAGDAAIEQCRAGQEYRDAHRAAALVLGAGLVEFGLLRGAPATLFETGAIATFFPHGVGHMVGLGVRDAGEILPGRELNQRAYPHLRVDLPLEAGHVVTIEPGLYFVPALLRDLDRRERLGRSVVWERAEAMLDFGGIRVENDVLITAHGPEVLTIGIA